MNSFPQTNEFDQTEKQFPYRFLWGNVIVMMLFGVIGAIGFSFMAVSDNKPLYWFFAIFCSLIFFMGAFVSIVNLFGNLHVTVTKDEIFIPSIWKWKSPTRIAFSDVSRVELLTLQGNTILQLSVGKKKYALTASWLPKKGDFQEIVEIVQIRIRPPSVEDLASILDASNRDWMERLDAAEALAKLHDPRGLDFLRASLKIDDPDIRGVAQEIVSELEKDKIIL